MNEETKALWDEQLREAKEKATAWNKKYKAYDPRRAHFYWRRKNGVALTHFPKALAVARGGGVAALAAKKGLEEPRGGGVAALLAATLGTGGARGGGVDALAAQTGPGEAHGGGAKNTDSFTVLKKIIWKLICRPDYK